MGRHSRGAGETPAPLPDPPARHPYAPRSAEDTGDRDRQSYRVVDVGLPPGSPGPSEPPRHGGQASGPRGGHGATRADQAESRFGAPPEPRFGGPAAAGSRFGGNRAAEPEPYVPSSGPDLTASRFGGSEPRFGATRADLVEPRFGGAGGSRAQVADPAGPRFGDGAASRSRAPAGDPAGSGFGRSEPRFGATRADLAEPRFGGSAPDTGDSRFRPPAGEGESRFGGSRLGGSESRSPALAPVRTDPAEPRFGATRIDLVEPPEPRFGADRMDAPEPRFGAARADLAESVGSTALAPMPAPDRDEVTDTGARRARSAFRLASGTTPAIDEDVEDVDDEEDDHSEHEPALLLQWAIFVAQTLTGAIAGLGVWLGFYRLWSTWPFYAVPAVGLAAIVMLVLARALRRRHGRDLDLLTSVVTAVVITVLTVLPAAFTLQGLTQ